MTFISGVGPIPNVGSVSPGGQTAGRSGASFADMMNQFVKQTNQDQMASDQAIQNLVEGKTESINDVVLAVSQAEMSFQLFMEIRNRVIESYNELMRMQF